MLGLLRRDEGKPHRLCFAKNAVAAPTTAMTHIAIQEKLDGKPVAWLEHVTAEQYEGRTDAR